MKFSNRLTLALATAALFAFTGCAGGDTKAAQAAPQAEASEGGCCGDGAAEAACAAEKGGCCAGEATPEQK
jgi:hypothetical protein